MSYKTFLKSKETKTYMDGFDPVWMPDFLFDFQKDLTTWAIQKGKAALFEDCGLGKTPQQLVWAENIRRKTKGNVLILTPLAVSQQTVKEGGKFDIEVRQTQSGKVYNGINVTNYERLDNYNPKDFEAVVLDESSILKNFDGKTRKKLTEFALSIDYRLLCSATPAPNDFTELGTSAEILGYMKYKQMLGMFFTHKAQGNNKWSIKGHAKRKYWQWISMWARAIRKPSDIGYENKAFKLPKMTLKNITVESKAKKGMLFPTHAITLNDQRKERKNTIHERCQKVKEVLPDNEHCLIWCNYNDESTLLSSIIKDAVEVKGSDKNTVKEQRLVDFTNGKIRVLVTKPSIAGWGLNWQHCHNMTFFPTHSYEQFYQAVRRCWRFGQKEKVICNLISSQSERPVLDNMMGKERKAEEMFNGIIREMEEFQKHKQKPIKIENQKMEIPSWL